MSNTDKKIALSHAIQDARELHMLRLELFEVIAAEMKAKFDAYVAAGFTAEQTMDLLCAGK